MNNMTQNPFKKIFEEKYEQLLQHPEMQRVKYFLSNLLSIDDQDFMFMITNELGNTITLYASKQNNNPIQSITLKLYSNADSFIPSIVFASAYDSYSIIKSYTKPSNILLPECNIPLYNEVQFGKAIFHELGGCDIDEISDVLFDVASDEEMVATIAFQMAQTLTIIKICELLHDACLLLVQGDRFKKLSITKPFSFFITIDDKEYITGVTID